MHDATDHDRPIETIEEMPAAPEADQGTRDADAPTWSAPTEGHPDLPLSAPLTAVGPGPDASAGAAADAAAGPGPEEITVTGPTPAASITADRVTVNQGGAQRISGRQVSVSQGGAAIIRGEQVRVEQGGAFAIVGRRIDIHEGGAFLLLARRVTGDVNVALDWRGIAALMAGILAIMVVRGRR